jgi:hypothetical protein
MADEVTTEIPAAPEPAQGEVHEPKNVREAVAMRRSQGTPEILSTDTVEAPAPTVETDPEAALLADLSAGTSATPAPPAEDPFAAYGGREAVEEARVIRDALATETGVRTLIAQGLHALGYSPDQVRAFMENRAVGEAAAAAAPADPLAAISDEDVVTGAEVKAVVQAAVAQALAGVTGELKAGLQPVQQQMEAQRQATAQQTVDGTLVELLGQPPTDPGELKQFQTLATAVLQAAAPYVQADNWDPQHIRAAIQRGHADYQAQLEAAISYRLAQKKAQAAAQPTNIGGATSGSEPAQEPKDLKEARAMARAMGLWQ